MDNEKAVVRLPLLSDRSKELDLLPLDNNEVGSLIHYKMDNVEHKLPNPQSLKPFMDTKTADIDMWPSHASNQNCGHTMTKLSRSKSLQLINAESLGKPNFIPQPKLLENLEGYLKNHLAFIDESAEENGNVSLEVYRKTFNHLINKLKTYKNLLSRIKIQYEMALDDLENQIKSLQPFKEKIVATAESYEQKIMVFNEQEKPGIKAVYEQNFKLEEEIEIMEEKLVYIEKEREESEEKLKEVYQLYRNEYDAQKLLDIEYKELGILQSNTQDSTDSSKPIMADNDLTTLKITLSQSIKDADATQAKLDEMIADYDDVVPRRQYEALEKKYAEIKESNEVSSNDLNILKAEHKALKEVIDQLNEELTGYKKECLSRKKSLPRTPWEKPCLFINPESNYFEGISSTNICENLLNILRDMDKNGAKILKRDIVYFDGKGLGEDVPKYLRYEGQVYNRQFNKRDCALLIKDIWRKRINFKKNGTFTDFIDIYLKQNFPTQRMKTEWAYNLVDACKRFAENNKNIELFWLILNHEMDENVYHCQLAVITDLMKSLEDSHVSVMKSSQFQEHLQKFLNPSDSKITATLVKVALQELESEDEINFGQLFLEDDEGEVGPFLTELKNWLQSLRIEFCDLVSQELDENSPVSIQSLDLAIRQTDPTLKTNAVKELLCWCYDTTPDVLLKSKPLPVDEVLSRLRNAGIRFSHIKTYF